MEIEAATATGATEPAVAAASGLPAQADGFGTRPQTGRPHSISLFGSDRDEPSEGASRALDILLGAGIGAAMMYYLDPDGGPERRARVRDKIVSAVTMAPDAFEVAADDVSRWARQTLDARTRSVSTAEWTPGARLVASAVGGFLTLVAARRRDALGAAVGLVGSALLARGVRATGRR